MLSLFTAAAVAGIFRLCTCYHSIAKRHHFVRHHFVRLLDEILQMLSMINAREWHTISMHIFPAN